MLSDSIERLQPYKVDTSLSLSPIRSLGGGTRVLDFGKQAQFAVSTVRVRKVAHGPVSQLENTERESLIGRYVDKLLSTNGVLSLSRDFIDTYISTWSCPSNS